MNINQYHVQDMEKALLEHICSMDLLNHAKHALSFDDLEEVKRSLKDIEKSVNELEKLKEKKRNYNQLVKIAQKLAQDGVLISVVQRRMRG
ncbi:nitrate reductase assembly molybdenum cofactor insertion protein NarJ [Bacillus pakistanensis]|uniref:Nitrate reductase assembly molybdenum cofactor insertion protein NarJ n=1 Tax=Rossellomorea pakistanensis TaxID=992288 RepID=A0ABS2ND78_9BACI|nr:hypothetical protein [Bacillus pakistanensis]MBM7585808.1 nitrate reductase assembly molybdenum cofactor insertion protein NarJ [Bacillus pakistanensis]